MNLALLIAIPFAYIVAEMIITTFFNRKIKYVSEGKFTQASRMGALATFLFLGSVVLSTLIADMAGLGKVGIYTYPIVTSAAMAIGNFIATWFQGYAIRKFERGERSKFFEFVYNTNEHAKASAKAKKKEAKKGN